MSFYLFDRPEEALRLKAFSASSRGGTFTIRIEITTSDALAFGHALRELGDVQKGQGAAKPKPQAKRLALPAPSYREGES